MFEEINFLRDQMFSVSSFMALDFCLAGWYFADNDADDIDVDSYILFTRGA